MNVVRTRNGNRTHPLHVGQARPRSPGVTYAVVTVALAVLVGTLSLTSRQSAPPTIAEFAPQAVEQITNSTGDVAGSRGGQSGEASTLGEQPGLNDAARQNIDVARVRECVGDPPRQIEDPQSPPCVPYWSGDNGGATSRGVTRDEIRVVDPSHGFGGGPSMATFFNERFEFYGRRMRLIPRDGAWGDPAGERAAARAAYAEDQAFASTGPPTVIDYDYLDELARLGVVAAHYQPVFTGAYLAFRRPYLWTYAMASDRLFAAAGDWYCARFAGRNAVHAGDPLLQVSPRKAGIVVTYGWRGTSDEQGTSAEPMNAQLSSCGARTDVVFHGAQDGDLAYWEVFMQNAMIQMKTSGVTTVVCLCDTVLVALGMRGATNQGYFPEWLVTSYLDNDSSAWMRRFGATSEQLKNLMLLLAHPMQRRQAEHPSNWAAQEGGMSGYPSGASFAQTLLDYHYQTLLLLASGFQLAGPSLTPETFERGLHRARFPNPFHPIMAGAVGFSDADHSMTDDTVEAWWSNTARSPYDDEGLGTYCYVDHGARRRVGSFPTDDPFFRGGCDNGAG